jgi:hypothetical protein
MHAWPAGAAAVSHSGPGPRDGTSACPARAAASDVAAPAVPLASFPPSERESAGAMASHRTADAIVKSVVAVVGPSVECATGAAGEAEVHVEAPAEASLTGASLSSSLSRPRVAVVLPAAGSGQRAGTPTAKQFWPVENNPLLFFTLTTLEKAAGVHSIVCPTTATEVTGLQRRAFAEWGFRKVKFVPGGTTRHRSIAAGVAAVSPDVDVIVVHDAVRPFVRIATRSVVVPVLNTKPTLR